MPDHDHCDYPKCENIWSEHLFVCICIHKDCTYNNGWSHNKYCEKHCSFEFRTETQKKEEEDEDTPKKYCYCINCAKYTCKQCGYRLYDKIGYYSLEEVDKNIKYTSVVPFVPYFPGPSGSFLPLFKDKKKYFYQCSKCNVNLICKKCVKTHEICFPCEKEEK